MTTPPLGPLPYRLGEPGSRFALNTPALVLDLDAFERNLASMAETMIGFGRKLRPHAKTHKSSHIAAAQLDAGAVGICCATLDEAEVMAAAGIRGLHLTSPITSEAKLARLTSLMAAAPDTMLVVDHPDNVARLAAAARHAGVKLNLLVDIDLGFSRTGVVTLDDAEIVAKAIARDDVLRFSGLQAYGGHLQHIPDFAARQSTTRAAFGLVEVIIQRLSAIGLPPAIVTGGGTGTHTIDGRNGVLTEIQAGSYIFMDADYRAVAYASNEDWPFATSLLVQATVVSVNSPGTVTIDAGTKALAVNGPKPVVLSPDLAGVNYEFAGDEHGRLRMAPGQAKPRLGQVVELMVSHCDPTVSLYDAYHCVRGDALVDIWPVDARGRR